MYLGETRKTCRKASYSCVIYTSMKISDKNFTDGLDRFTFVQNIDHVVKSRFWWPPLVAEVVKHEYTNWSNLTDPFVNRDNFIQVRGHLQSNLHGKCMCTMCHLHVNLNHEVIIQAVPNLGE